MKYLSTVLHSCLSEQFSYDICKFKVQKSKEGTGRVVVWQMGIMNSYTMEVRMPGLLNQEYVSL